jgi:hypothetical protein
MLTGNKLIIFFWRLFEWSYEKAVLNSQKKWTIWGRRSDRPLIYKNRRIIYHKRYQGNTAHNKIQEKEFDVVLAKKLNEVM